MSGSNLQARAAKLLGLLWLGFMGPLGASAFTADDANTAFKAYRDAFYFTRGTNGYFRETTSGGKTWFWERAEQMEMLLDVYERTTNAECLVMFSNVFNGFITDHGSDWRRNEFNDDIMWAVIACARAYQHTGNVAFRDVARANFDMCHARAWSTNLGGGLWWKTDNQSKNACVNGPAAIAAYLLSQICAETNYLAISRRVFEWERATLFDTNSGAIADSIDRHGKLAMFNLTYNQGTFIGAANFLGHANDAKKAADFMMHTLSHDGLMPPYRQSGDAGGFHGIGARWLAKFMKQRGLEADYQTWLQANADAAWSVRRTSDNLSWSRWTQPTPARELHSWSCSSAVVLMHVVPPNAGETAVAISTNETTWSGAATNARGETVASFKVNTAEAPDLSDWGKRAGQLCVEWYPRLIELLPSEGFAPAQHIQLNFSTNYDGVAATSGDRINISANYVRRATNDFGMVIHELVHVVQAYRRGGNPGWLVEDVADYIRLSHYEPEARRPRIDPQRASYRDAYKTTAIFLEWAEKKYDAQLVKELNRAMREGAFQMELFKSRTGKTVDELWVEFAATLGSHPANAGNAQR